MTIHSKPRAVVFDWDNTLVDSWLAIQHALNATFRAYNLPEWCMDDVRTKVRKSTRDSFPAIFGDEWEDASKLFYAQYEEIHADAIQPADGAAELLEYLVSQNIYLGVVSNKRGDYLRAEANNLDWTKHFSCIVGALDAERDKPDPAPVFMTLAPGKVETGDDVWFVGDADIDLTCGVNAGCTPVLIRPEKPKAGEFPESPPTFHFSSCRHLCNFLQTM
jgi:phosphoglycolate phosphatase